MLDLLANDDFEHEFELDGDDYDASYRKYCKYMTLCLSIVVYVQEEVALEYLNTLGASQSRSSTAAYLIMVYSKTLIQNQSVRR